MEKEVLLPKESPKQIVLFAWLKNKQTLYFVLAQPFYVFLFVIL